MRQLLVLAAVAGLALARPETYREKEDFQYSRSSTDEGSKSGYYGAQRGNMGGNYERAHNMDPLAQHQMGGLVRTVEGELGDGVKQSTGSVSSSANSRGVYGSGHYDLSNLEGRNFQEGESHGSQSHSSLTSRHSSGYKGQFSTTNQAGYGSNQFHNAGYSSSQSHDSRYGGHNSAANSEHTLYSNNQQQASDNLQSQSQYDDRHSAQNSGYYSQAAGYQGQEYDHTLTRNSDAYGSNIHSRLLSGNPVRVVIRPGTKVIVPVAAQTYDASQSASTFDRNTINSETEVLNGNDQAAVLKPKTKHYESSYSYRKEWEKHDTKPVSGVVPLTIPTVNPYPVNSELYEDAQAQTIEQQRQSAHRIAAQSHHSSQSGYNVNSASSSQSRQADYNSQLYNSGANTDSVYHGAYNADSNGAYNTGASNTNNRRIASGAYIGTTNGASVNQIEDTNTKPKSYQSSYSYHKSWERQGDPYVIKPSTNGLYEGQASERLTAASLNQGYGTSHQYGSHHQSHQSSSSHSEADCDENGHIRVARSPNSQHHDHQTRGDVVGQEDFGQQTQTKWDNIELGQQTQNSWDQVGQQTEDKWDKLQDVGQQTQTWGQQETQNHWDKIEDFGQQIQNQWDQHDVGQQTQNTWDKLEIEPQTQTELGQQTQDLWTTPEIKPIESDARITEQKPSQPDNSNQGNHGMEIYQTNENTFEIASPLNHQMLNTESHTLETGTNKSSHHVHTIWDEIKREEIGQESENTDELDLAQTADLGQQTQVSWGNINQSENSFNPWHPSDDKIQVGSTNSEHSNTFVDMPNPHPWMYNQVYHHENSSDSNQYFAHSMSSSSFSGSHSNSWQQQHSTNINSDSNNSNVQAHSTGSSLGSVMSLWDKLGNIEKQTLLSQRNDDTDGQYVRQHGTANVFSNQMQHTVFDTHVTGDTSKAQNDVFESHSTGIMPEPSIITTITTMKPSIEIIKKDEVQPHDIGRGDIGPEDSSNEQNKPVNSKPYKTPEEIETLSLTKETGKMPEDVVMQDNNYNKGKNHGIDLSVVSLDVHNHSEQDKDKNTATLSHTQNTNYHHMDHSENANHMHEETDRRGLEQQFQNQAHQNFDLLSQAHQEKTDQKFETQSINKNVSFQQESEKHDYHHVQHNENIHHMNEETDKGGWEQQFQNQAHQNLDPVNQAHQNTDQKLVDFGQQSENFGFEQMEQQFETQNIGQIESLQQENKKHDIKELSQQNEQFDQVSLSGWKPDKNFDQQEHKLENWGQENENLEQQSQSGWAENMEDQQVQAAWMPTENLQQHSELVESFAQPMDNLDQQVQTAWEPTMDIQKGQVPDTFAPQVDQNKENTPNYKKQPEVIEEVIVPKKVISVVSVDSPPEPEPVTEKPGFWKSVGSKFTNAKDKVTSWFSSS